MDLEVAAIKPGITLKEFETDGIGRALDFWDPAPGGLRETVFFVSVREGDALVSDEVVCQFDKQLERNPEFLRRIARGRAEIQRGLGVRLEDVPLSKGGPTKR